MAESESDQILETCPSCAALVDTTDEEPYAHVHCPMCGKAMRVRKEIGNFVLEDILGSGGMGRVYQARDLNLNRRVALKLLHREYSQSREHVAKLEQEAKLTASVVHPNVVKVFSFGSDRGHFFIAMELVDKGDLDKLMQLQNKIAETQVLRIGIQVAQGLNAALKRGLIHRDVKPGNILFADAETAKIVDFGLAQIMEEEAESRGEVWGTPYYVAPEKLHREPEDFRSDMYSLGATLFHAMAGRPMFEAETASLVVLKHIKSQTVSLQAFAPDVTSETAYVVNRMVARDPDERYASYSELVEHLQYAYSKLTESGGAGARSRERVVVESKRMQTLAGWLTLGGFAVVILLAVFAALNWESVTGKVKLKDYKEPTVTAVPVEVVTEESKNFEAARETLLGGDYGKAATEFRAILDGGPVPQPLKSWILLHEGMSHLLAGDTSRSRVIFGELYKRGPFSKDPAERALADFFLEVGQAMSEPVAPPRSALAVYSKKDYQALAYLLFGLKSWELERFNPGTSLLKEFVVATPEGDYEWVRDYRTIAKTYLSKYDLFTAAMGTAQNASSLEALDHATQALNTAVGQLGHCGLLREPLRKRAEELADRRAKLVAEMEAERAKRLSAAEIERERRLLGDAEKDYQGALSNFSFSALLESLDRLTFREEAMARRKEELVKKARWVSEFKETLVQDLNRAGYKKPVTSIRGSRYRDGIDRASESKLWSTTPYGALEFTWSDLSPQTILILARHFIHAAPEVKEGTRRTWLAGAYAHECGFEEEGRALLIKASEEAEQYRGDLDVFFAAEDG